MLEALREGGPTKSAGAGNRLVWVFVSFLSFEAMAREALGGLEIIGQSVVMYESYVVLNRSEVDVHDYCIKTHSRGVRIANNLLLRE